MGLENFEQLPDIASKQAEKSDAEYMPNEIMCGENDAQRMPDEISCGENDAERMPNEIWYGDDAEKLFKGTDDVNTVAKETDGNANEVEEKNESVLPKFELNTYTDLDSMKQNMDKTYGEIKENKPTNSPNIAKWFDNGGSMKVERIDGKPVWTYIDKVGKEVSYVDGYPVFPLESKHPVIGDIDIGKFTGDRNEDKQLYLKELEKQYGLTEIPDGYALHHDAKNGNMQLVKEDWHKEFTHAGGHSLFKEV